ncbi:hypothetical protein AB0G64_15420 [Streptomyces longwoodensis]|uniref:hypothetical protein n=1 Tax=Streptomyces longwoodensis TaxID=68231 RepID=UPI003406BF83
MVLLAAVVACLGFAAHAESSQAAPSMTTVSAPAIPAAAPADHHAASVAHLADCPAGDVCCVPAGDRVRAVLVAPAQPLHAILPLSDLPRQPDTSPLSTEPVSTGRAPDLHVLQVQRT